MDSALDLEAAQNRIWFSLRLGDVHSEKSLVEEFQAHLGGKRSLTEILEKIDDDTEPMAVKDPAEGEEASLDAQAQLGARRISPL